MRLDVAPNAERGMAAGPVTAAPPVESAAPSSFAFDLLKTGAKTLIAVIAMLIVGLSFSEASFFPALVYAGIWASAALGLSLLIGWGGQISLGQAGLVAVAAYGSGLASVELQAPFLVAAVIGVTAAVAVAFLTSPILRIRGFYFVLATLALGTIVYQLLVAMSSVTGGADGLLGIEQLSIFGFVAQDTQTFFFISWGLAIFGAVILERMISGRYGRALKMQKASPDLAAGVGVPVARAKAIAWIISAMYAGIAGVVFTYYSGFIAPENFQLDQSIYILAAVMVAVGGKSLWGTMLGTILILAGPQIVNLSSDETHLATALLLIFATIALATSLLRPVADVWHRVERQVGAWMRALVGRVGGPAFAGAAGEGSVVAGPLATVERPTRAAGDERPAPGGEPVPALELSGVEKSFGGLRVLRGIDLRVEPGTIQGLIGPNGAGKTSLLSCAIGSLAIDGGSVRLFGESLAGRSPDQIARQGLVRTFQHPHLIDDESVLVNVMMGAYLAGEAGFLSPVVAQRRVWHEEERLRAIAMQALRDVDLEDQAGESAGDLTAGRRRLVATAQALAAGPRVLLLDEPAAGLNDIEMGALANSLADFRDLGMTIVVIEHHLEFVAKACDTVAALVDGHIVTNAPAEEVMRHPDVVRAYLGGEL